MPCMVNIIGNIIKFNIDLDEENNNIDKKKEVDVKKMVEDNRKYCVFWVDSTARCARAWGEKWAMF